MLAWKARSERPATEHSVWLKGYLYEIVPSASNQRPARGERKMKPGKSGLIRIVDATVYTIKGLRAAFANEAAFRQELLLVLVLGTSSFWLADNTLEWLVLIIPLLLLLIVELLNTAIENTVDRIGDEIHELAGRAKDMGSAAVMLSLILVAICWGAIGWSHFNA